MAKLSDKLYKSHWFRKQVRRVIPGYQNLLDRCGFFQTSRDVRPNAKREMSVYYAYKERTEVAMAAASMYRQGDYFEFGADSLFTFRSFLTAWDIFGQNDAHPDTRFYAFDIFGRTQTQQEYDANDKAYFESWKSGDSGDKFEECENILKEHGLFESQCILKQGYFEETLTADFKADYLNEGRKIGFAFIDCNILSSYQTVFKFLDGMLAPRCFIYLDEYFCDAEIEGAFLGFTKLIEEKYGMRTTYMRNAGAFGALFSVQTPESLEHDLG